MINTASQYQASVQPDSTQAGRSANDRHAITTLSRQRVKRADIMTSWFCFLAALLTYWLTVAPGASYWDCPEYIATAAGLQVGHPPGNPTWTLIHRMVTLIAPAGKEALAINLASGLFTAIAVALTSRIAFAICSMALHRLRDKASLRLRTSAACIASATGAMSLAWCDSVWFSAVEAEVYALSLMLTALTIWFIVCWLRTPLDTPDGQSRASRLLILDAYVLGLSLGVHQLNLLVVPAIAIMMAFRRRPRQSALWPALGALAAGCVVIILILSGMMPGTVRNACDAELFFVNTLNLPYLSGVAIYLLATLLFFIVTLAFLQKHAGKLPQRLTTALFLSASLFCSGIFLIADNQYLNLFLSVCSGGLLIFTHVISRNHLRTSIWMLAMTLLGMSIFLIIPIRSASMPPLNEATPATPFAFRAYLQREQYGAGESLLKGPTPYSRPLFHENIDADSIAHYNRYATLPRHIQYRRALHGMHPANNSRLLTHGDSLRFNELSARGGDAYLPVDYAFRLRKTPELDMWFSRLRGTTPDDVDSYRAWAGMDSATMTKVEISETLDSNGMPAGKLGSDGKRHRSHALKPSYLHHARFLLGYQIGYMYLRYLLWNFSGRQNDIPSTGEAEHGNFITGLPILDNAMLGPQDSLPSDKGAQNPGHNEYYMLPLLLGLAGAIWLATSGRRARRADTAVLLLFLLTGVAIVVYLNQNTGQPRERDYSFLGSYMAYSLWIAAGAAGVFAGILRLSWKLNLKRISKTAFTLYGTALTFCIPLLMLAENIDDHDRSRRTAADDFACNILESLEPEAIIFVDGDNMTFPLWYAQEVRGIRRDVRVVNITYLTQPDYVLQLMTQAYSSAPLPMTARPEQILSGRFATLTYPATDTLDAVEALRRLYSDVSPRAPMPASAIRIRIADDSIHILPISKVAHGSSLLRRRDLMMLDIFATNAASRHPRPIYVASNLGPDRYPGIEDLSLASLYARRLPPAASQQYLDSVSLRQLPKLRYGGFNLSRPPYTDLTVQREASFQRTALLLLAERMLEAGRPAEAARVTRLALTRLPFATVPPYVVSDRGRIFDEALRAAMLLARCSGQLSGDTTLRSEAIAILMSRKRQAAEANRYVNAMGNARRATIGARTRRLAASESNINHLIDSLRDIKE